MPPDLDAYLSQLPEQEVALSSLFPRNAKLVILDIGACEGEDSIRYARRFPYARIFSFEPLPSNQQLIQLNFCKYKIQTAELVPLALSNSIGAATFHISSGTPEQPFIGDNWNYGNKSNSLLPPSQTGSMHGWIKFQEAITVPTTTLDHFCRERSIRRLDFIHMDVQGAEIMVLEGAGPKLRDITALWLEVADEALYSGQPLRGQVQEFMGRHGFSLAFEISRTSEGDQFYVNLRNPRVWPWLLRITIVRWLAQARFVLGAWKNSGLGFFRK